MNRSAILFTTHFVSDFVDAQLKKLCDEVDHGKFDVYVLYDQSRSVWDYPVPDGCSGVYGFDTSLVTARGFTMHRYYPSPIRKEFYGNNFEYSFMSFGIDHPQYDYIYLIEYDVYYNGSWGDLLSRYEDDDSDWIASNVVKFDDMSSFWKMKMWKVVLSDGVTLPDESRIRTFNPMFRLSRRALDYLVDLSSKGCYGFYECYIPSVLKSAGYTVRQWSETIGCDQDSPTSSMRFIERGGSLELSDMQPGVLYHPLKHY